MKLLNLFNKVCEHFGIDAEMWGSFVVMCACVALAAIFCIIMIVKL